MLGSQQLPLLDPGALTPDWEVRPSPRARRLTVKVFPGGRVEIVVPVGTRPHIVQGFVARHRSWIESKVEEFQHLDAAHPGEPPAEVAFHALGERWPVAYEQAGGALRLREAGGTLVVRGELERTRLVRHALQRWVMRRAHSALVPWLAEVAGDTGLEFSRAQIRRQRTRWGSCSRAGTISLNACLLFQPPTVVRYLFIHELAHTRHMNHSVRFWRLVGELEPEWRALDRELMRGWRHVPRWVFA
jgi:hypothetical protein